VFNKVQKDTLYCSRYQQLCSSVGRS